MRLEICRSLNTLAIYLFSLIITGAYIYQFTTGKNPCPLCMLQRLCMISASIGFMLNLRFHFDFKHYALVIGSCILGGSIAIRHLCLHLCPSFYENGEMVFGFHLYTWSLFIFIATLIGLFVLFLIHKKEDLKKARPLNLFEWGALLYMFLIAFADVITTFQQCGMSAC